MKTRKAILQTLTSAITDLDNLVMFEELKDGQRCTKNNVVAFLKANGEVATSMMEKLAGCQARLRSR